MTVLVFHCPYTEQEIDPGIEGVEADQPGSVRFVALHVRCPHCGAHHEIRLDDTQRLTRVALPGPSRAA